MGPARRRQTLLKREEFPARLPWEAYRDEQALISASKNNQIAGAAIDVFDIEPLPPSHPLPSLDNVMATPHIGYVSHGLYKTFYEDTASNIGIDTH
jgi:phosphoglycerate dehydrogenase-like enzyme